MMIAERVLRYLYTTSKLGLRFEADVEIKLVGYSDASWKDCKETLRSTGGFAIFFEGSAAIVAKAKRQAGAPSLSSCESETKQISICVQHIVWLRNLLGELGWPQEGPTVIYEDNQATINLAHHGYLSEQTIHMSLKDLYVVHYVKKGTVKVQYLDTAKMTADIFTKPLSIKDFNYHRKALLNSN